MLLLSAFQDFFPPIKSFLVLNLQKEKNNNKFIVMQMTARWFLCGKIILSRFKGFILV